MDFRTHNINGDNTYISDSGYVRVFVGVGEHPHENKGYCAAHRLVMEAHLGRYIKPYEVVHHINEVKTDNRLESLYLCTQEEHAAIHHRGRYISLSEKSKIRKGVRRSRSVG